MKKVLQSVAVATTMLLATNASAQLPDNGVYPGGLVLESYVPVAGYSGNHIYEMGSWDIDSILDSGSSVILDLFGTWCGPCWDFHEGHEFNGIYDVQGWGGTNDVAIFAVDASGQANTFEGPAGGSAQGDWINDTKYPMVDNVSLGSMFNVTGFPTMVAICPDRTVTEISRLSATTSNALSIIGSCGAAATATNDPRIVTNNTDESISSCGSSAATVEAVVSIQNYSTAAINATYTVKIFNGAVELATTDVLLNLPAYGAQSVTVGTVPVSEGTNNYTAKITTTNEDLTNDEIAVVVEGIVAQDMNIASTDLTVSVNMNVDGYANEIGVVFHSGVPTDGLVGTYNNGSGSLGYMAIGTLAQGASFAPLNYTIDAAGGCHYFAFVDYENDGINWNTPAANATISTTAGGSLVVDGDWGSGVFTLVNFVEVLGVESNTIENLSIYPNPANAVANVKMTLTEVSNVSISLVNTLGQIVYNTELGNVNGTQNVQINTTDLEAGMYLVNTTVNGVVSTDRISIVK